MVSTAPCTSYNLTQIIDFRITYRKKDSNVIDLTEEEEGSHYPGLIEEGQPIVDAFTKECERIKVRIQ